MKNHIFLFAAVFIFTSVGIATASPNVTANAASTVPRPTPEKALGKTAAEDLVAEATDWLSDLTDDEQIIEAITEKWNVRKDLPGKTRTQILKLLYADAKSVITNKESLDAFTKGWNANNPSAGGDVPAKAASEAKTTTPSKPAAQPVGTPIRSGHFTGTISKMMYDKQFGYVTAATGEEYFFHMSAAFDKFEDLRVGQGVTFDVVQDAKGFKVLNVRLVP